MTLAERTANRLLRKHGCDAAPVDVVAVAELEGLAVVYHRLEGDVSGLLLRQEESATVAVNVFHHENRQRFTVSHELGHFLLHKDQPTVFVDDVMVHFRADKPGFDPREKEANEFAAALLMPRSLLKADLHGNPIDAMDEDAVRSLARRYQVSQQALTIRLVNLGFITRF